MANTLRYNNTIPGNIYYNNAKVQNVYYNNTKVWSASRPFAFTYTGAYETEGNLEGNFIIRFKTSGTLTITNHGNTNGLYDVFLVGGGAGGGSGKDGQWTSHGGCGGYTTTKKKINTNLNTSYSIIIGSGGAKGTVYGSNTEYYGGDGGASSGLGNTANGATVCKSMSGDKINNYAYVGGYGGSGGGGPAINRGSDGGSDGGNGGSDGSDGYTKSTSFTYWLNGKGQGTTTREFGESSGKLYAGGGGGGGYNYTYSYAGKGGEGGGGKGQGYSRADNTGPFAGTANTGGGGGAGYVEPQGGCSAYGAEGGSGIVCIRNAR